MGRAERLLELEDRLRGTGVASVAALAQELGVSRRTVLRDLAALRRRGVPLVTGPGRHGGVRLDEERGVTAVHLTLSEIVSIWLAARLSREATEIPWGNAASTGMAKLLASLPDAKAKALRALSRRVVVEPPASANLRATARSPPPELLAVFEDAFSRGMGLAFDYTDRQGGTSTRRIEPHGLVVAAPLWYVLARDLDKREPRTFRMDRIARPRLLRDVTFRPDLGLIRAQFPDGGRGSTPLAGRWSE